MATSTSTTKYNQGNTYNFTIKLIEMSKIGICQGRRNMNEPLVVVLAVHWKDCSGVASG